MSVSMPSMCDGHELSPICKRQRAIQGVASRCESLLMPLIAHSASTCDVCLELYSWDTSSDAKKPFALACGHIFCLGCLRQIQRPTICPLCRKAFLPERAKKLRIDCPSPLLEHADYQRVNDLLRRVAESSAEDQKEEEVQQVIGDVHRWLETRQDSQHIVYKPLSLAVLALRRQRESLSIREMIETREQTFQRLLHVKEQDLRTSRTIEENLVERMNTLEDEYKEKLASAEKSRAETDIELALLRAEHAQFRSKLAQYQERDPFGRIAPPSINSGYPEIYRDTSRVRGGVLRDGQPDIFRNGAIHGRDCACNENRTYGSALYDLEEECECELARRRRRASGIIPGAPASKKVVPPLPSARSNSKAQSASKSNRKSDYPSREPTRQDQRDSMQSERTPRAGGTSDMYGSNTGNGYAPLDHPELAAVTEGQPLTDELQLFTEPNNAVWNGGNYAPRRTFEAAAHTPAVFTWPYVPNALMGNASANRSTRSVASVGTIPASVDQTADSSRLVSAAASLSDLGILAAPISSLPAPTASARTIPQDVVRDSPSPVPSGVSTWGTNVSLRSSRSVSVRDLNLARLPSTMNLATEPHTHNASLADLNLANLPETRPFSLIGATGGHEGPYGGRPETPRAVASQSRLSVRAEHRSSSVHSDVVPSRHSIEQASSASSADEHVPLNGQEDDVFGPVASSLAGTHISSQQDLQQVDVALHQLLQDRSRQRRQSLYATAPAPTVSADIVSHAQDRIAQAVDRGPSGVRGGHPPPVPMSTRPANSPAAHRRVSEDIRVPSSITSSAHRHATFDEHSPSRASFRAARARSISMSASINREVPAAADSPDLATMVQHGTVWSPLGIAASQSRDALMDGGSLLLNFTTAATSTATTSSGSPTAIHAPRPVDRRQSRFLGFLNDPRQRH